VSWCRRAPAPSPVFSRSRTRCTPCSTAVVT
jgi:hypothetical protein